MMMMKLKAAAGGAPVPAMLSAAAPSPVREVPSRRTSPAKPMGVSGTLHGPHSMRPRSRKQLRACSKPRKRRVAIASCWNICRS